MQVEIKRNDKAPQSIGDPELRTKRLLDRDLARAKIHALVKQAKVEYFDTFKCEPSWARVTFDLVHAAGAALLKDGDTIAGLPFVLDMTHRLRVEVGSSTWVSAEEFSVEPLADPVIPEHV